MSDSSGTVPASGNEANPSREVTTSARQVPKGWHWVACPLCASTEFVHVFDAESRLFGDCTSASLYRCDCGLGLTNPQPSGEALAALYRDVEYYTHTAREVSRRSLRQRIRPCFMTWWALRVRAAIERRFSLPRFASRWAPDHFGMRATHRVLDYGCGDADSTSLLVALGIEVHGVEPDPVARGVAAARGVRAVESLDLLKGLRFDRVVLRHVLEHLPDPIDILRTLCDYLKPNGKVLILVPNYGSAQADRYGKHWIGFDMPRHLWHFTMPTLRRLAEEAGLHVEVMRTNELQFFAERSARQAREAGEVAMYGREQAYQIERTGRGCEIVGVFVPNSEHSKGK
jgi:2-polyprenyl-3-methyl-5-hydroxy-6-metoxy-1,4-benzoquinol methylase